jgi:transposase
MDRDLRGVVVGRKNHYGSRSERGTQVAALLYSLIETAKHHGLPEATYLRQAAEHALRNPGSPLLPPALLG